MKVHYVMAGSEDNRCYLLFSVGKFGAVYNSNGQLVKIITSPNDNPDGLDDFTRLLSHEGGEWFKRRAQKGEAGAVEIRYENIDNLKSLLLLVLNIR